MQLSWLVMAWHGMAVLLVYGVESRSSIATGMNEWMNWWMVACDERNAIGDVVVPDCAKQVKWANIKGSRLLGVDWIWIPAQEISAILTFIQLCCIICDFAPHDRLSGLFVWSRFFFCVICFWNILQFRKVDCTTHGLCQTLSSWKWFFRVRSQCWNRFQSVYQS